MSTAKEEATAAIETAEAKSKIRAEHIVGEAHDQLEKDVTAAKKALQKETLELVALATEKVIGKTVNASVDKAVITNCRRRRPSNMASRFLVVKLRPMQPTSC